MEDEPKPNVPPLPRPLADPDGIQKLREEARRRLDEEASKLSSKSPLANPAPGENTAGQNRDIHATVYGGPPVGFHRLQKPRDEINQPPNWEGIEAVDKSEERTDGLIDLLKRLNEAPRSSVFLRERLHQGSPAEPNSENLGNEPGEAGQKRNVLLAGLMLYGAPPLGIRENIGAAENRPEETEIGRSSNQDGKGSKRDLASPVANSPSTPSGPQGRLVQIDTGESRPPRRYWKVWVLFVVILTLLLGFTFWLFHKSS